MQQFIHGRGDHSKDRRHWVDKLTLEQIRAGIEAQHTTRGAPQRRRAKGR